MKPRNPKSKSRQTDRRKVNFEAVKKNLLILLIEAENDSNLPPGGRNNHLWRALNSLADDHFPKVFSSEYDYGLVRVAHKKLVNIIKYLKKEIQSKRPHNSDYEPNVTPEEMVERLLFKKESLPVYYCDADWLLKFLAAKHPQLKAKLVKQNFIFSLTVKGLNTIYQNNPKNRGQTFELKTESPSTWAYAVLENFGFSSRSTIQRNIKRNSASRRSLKKAREFTMNELFSSAIIEEPKSTSRE